MLDKLMDVYDESNNEEVQGSSLPKNTSPSCFSFSSGVYREFWESDCGGNYSTLNKQEKFNT